MNASKTTSIPSTYPKIIIVMHWVTLIAVLLGVIAIYARGLVEGRVLRSELLDLHRSFELLVLAIALLRIASYVYARRRHVRHELPISLRLMGSMNHLALYSLMLTLPMVGWMQSNARGQVVDVFGLFSLPALIGKNRDLAEALAVYHQWAAWVFFILIFSHAAAALWHHFLRRDAVLISMLPLIKLRHSEMKSAA